MDLNSFIALQKKVTGQSEEPASAPTVDHTAATNVALDMARRKAETPKPEEQAIPSAGATPIPN